MRSWLRGEWEIEILLNDEQVIGYAVFRLGEDDFEPDEKFVYLRQFYIRREHRRKGYGTGALAHLIRFSFPEGAKVCVDVLNANARGVRFWRKFGFEPYWTRMEL
ncbi:GNAT family N-acetyltransferase [Cohnella algarum]|uniref:GNAT family N-acetyltransferase n=1 Tax=Cohnella algarum TaxID=2044859 RepID=UPI00196721C2|nr:GNAT family N-acetyltransferase [Cohnella algarum]MBN2983276.1 GNAT family N-acetyltransferase [Cohnella algarum]